MIAASKAYATHTLTGASRFRPTSCLTAFSTVAFIHRAQVQKKRTRSQKESQALFQIAPYGLALKLNLERCFTIGNSYVRNMSGAKQITVLLVEDDGALRMLFAAALQDAGFDVLEAETADEALALLINPDHVWAVITDVRIPGKLDGIEFALEVRKMHPEMPLIVASGYAAQLADRLRSLKPPTIFLAKPFPLEKMVATMQKLTQRQ